MLASAASPSGLMLIGVSPEPVSKSPSIPSYSYSGTHCAISLTNFLTSLTPLQQY